MANVYTEKNRVEREAIAALCDRLTDADMDRPVGTAGWTIGGILCHLAFYDQRAHLLLEKWKREGITPSPNDVDLVNEAMRPLFNAARPEEVRKLVPAMAHAVDAAIDGLTSEMLARVEKEGAAVRLSRALHREHHRAQIEAALA